MTKDYKIAILLPTRGRTAALSRSIESLITLAEDVDSIQIMLGFDNDDTVGIEHFQSELQPWLDQHHVNYTAMTFAPMGYIRLNEYVNTLAKNSSADWLVFWNDDAVMETQGWDREIASYTGEFKILAFKTHNDHPYSIFPIVPCDWLTVLGHLSPHQISDGWISQVAYCVDIMQRTSIQVKHDRADLTGNNLDQTYKNRPMLEGNPSSPHDFHHYTWAAKRSKDCDTLTDYMKSKGLDTSWWEKVKQQKQDPWEKLRDNDPNDQMRQFNIDRTGKVQS